ncbi:hypothetical protein EV359DRAFT_85069 [Lentinula novae-zelandiae]|nr:hypothetical protein EV359DRAFT_85069 [Lentinula novae-zelandiae]
MSHLTSTSSNSSDESVDLCNAMDLDSEDDDIVLENEANLSATLLKQVIPKWKGDPSPLFVALAEPEFGGPDVNNMLLIPPNQFSATLGNMPLIYLKGRSEKTGAHIYGKAEFQNPGGSMKDRAALGVC